MVWAAPALLIAAGFVLLSPKERADDRERHARAGAIGGRWWPDWKNPLIWLIGLTFGSNNSPFFAANAFLGDYLASLGRPEYLGPVLSSLNGAQILALILLLVMAGRLQRRAWPFLVFGPVMLAGFLGLILYPAPLSIIISTAAIGIGTAVTMTATLAMPALLVPAGDVPRTAAGMFTVAYTCAIIIPTICGALWDVTGKPWTTFIPLCLCSVTLTVFGAIVVRYRPPAEIPLDQAA
jgi:CP family cyanate transporter-like MFS transporter